MNNQEQYQIDKPTNYLPLAIIGTLISCLAPYYCVGVFTGIAAIYYASRVSGLYYNHRYAEAESAAQYAKILSFVALGIGILGLLYTGYQIKTNPEILEESQRMADEIMKSYGK